MLIGISTFLKKIYLYKISNFDMEWLDLIYL